MKSKTPKAITNGHENLCSELKSIIKMNGATVDSANHLEKIMTAHFEKEEKYALPPLGLLIALSEGHWELDEKAAVEMSDMLNSRLAELKEEHESISKTMQDLKEIADKEDNTAAHKFITNLRIHMELEDQVLYPASILIVHYLKNNSYND